MPFSARMLPIGVAALLPLLAISAASAASAASAYAKPRQIFCPSEVTVDPSVALLPPRSTDLFLNASSTDGTPYQIYTASMPVIQESVVQFHNAEVCLPEGAAASFVVRTDVYADVAAAPYEQQLQKNQQARTWIPRPDDPAVEAYWGIETVATIRFGRDYLNPMGSYVGDADPARQRHKVFCENVAAASILPRTQARITSKFITRPCILTAAHPSQLLPSETALSDLSDKIYEVVMANLKVEVTEVANIIFGKALRSADACTAFPLSVDGLLGPLPPAPVSALVLADDPTWARESSFPPREVCLEPSFYADESEEVLSDAMTELCFGVSEYALRNIRIYESKASSDGLFHIKGLVQIGYRYEPVASTTVEYVAFADVPFVATVDPSSLASTVGVSYDRAETMLLSSTSTVDPMKTDVFRAASTLYDIDISKHLLEWVFTELRDKKYITSFYF